MLGQCCDASLHDRDCKAFLVTVFLFAEFQHILETQRTHVDNRNFGAVDGQSALGDWDSEDRLSCVAFVKNGDFGVSQIVAIARFGAVLIFMVWVSFARPLQLNPTADI